MIARARVWLAFACCAAACVVLTGASALPARVAIAATSNTAVVVIDTGSSVRSALVEVGDGTSGLATLQKAAAVVTYGFSGQGAAVCSIDGVGNPSGPSCLIGPNGEYWAYWRAVGGSGTWAYSSAGSGSTTVRGGDVEGWRWGTGQKPGASAVYCDYTACAAPTTTTTSATAVPPVITGATGDGASASGAAAPSPAPTPAPDARTGATVGASDDARGVAPDRTAAAPATGADPNASTTPAAARAGGDGQLAAEGTRGGAPDAGSPAGLAIAGGLLAVAIVVAVLVRRRRSVRAP